MAWRVPLIAGTTGAKLEKAGTLRVPAWMVCLVQTSGLTLGELEAGACAAETVLFALFLASIAGQETCGLENGAEFRVDLAEGAGDAVAQGFGLTGHAAAGAASLDVVLVDHLDQLERLLHDHLQGLAREVILEGTTVNGNLPGTGVEAGTGDGVLSFSSAVSEIAHDDPRLNIQSFGSLGSVRVLGTGVDLELLEKLGGQAVLRQHAFDCGGDDVFRLLCQHLAQGLFLQTAGMVGVLVIHLLVELLSGNLDLIGVDNDDEVAHVHVGGEFRLVLATQTGGDLCGQAAQDLV